MEIKLALYASLTDVVHTALHIAFISSVISVVPSIGSFNNGLSTRLSDSSSVPASNTNLSKDLVTSTPSLFITVAFLTCTDLNGPTISTLIHNAELYCIIIIGS